MMRGQVKELRGVSPMTADRIFWASLCPEKIVEDPREKGEEYSEYGLKEQRNSKLQGLVRELRAPSKTKISKDWVGSLCARKKDEDSRTRVVSSAGRRSPSFPRRSFGPPTTRTIDSNSTGVSLGSVGMGGASLATDALDTASTDLSVGSASAGSAVSASSPVPSSACCPYFSRMSVDSQASTDCQSLTSRRPFSSISTMSPRRMSDATSNEGSITSMHFEGLSKEGNELLERLSQVVAVESNVSSEQVAQQIWHHISQDFKKAQF